MFLLPVLRHKNRKNKRMEHGEARRVGHNYNEAAGLIELIF